MQILSRNAESQTLAAIIFYSYDAKHTIMWRCPIQVLEFISTNRDMFPCEMKKQATWWLNEHQGKHKPPTDKQIEARRINWMLHQLEGIKSQLGHMMYHTRKDDILYKIANNINTARIVTNEAIEEIRKHNLQLTGKPPLTWEQRFNKRRIDNE